MDALSIVSKCIVEKENEENGAMDDESRSQPLYVCRAEYDTDKVGRTSSSLQIAIENFISCLTIVDSLLPILETNFKNTNMMRHHCRQQCFYSLTGGLESASQSEEESGGDEATSPSGRIMSSGKFDLMASPTHESSRVGSKFQAEIPPLISQPLVQSLSSSSSSSVVASSSASTAISSRRHGTRGASRGTHKAASDIAGGAGDQDASDLESSIMERMWCDSAIPSGFDVDAFIARCRALRKPTAGTILRVWNNSNGKCQWCVFLRHCDKEEEKAASSKEKKGKGASSSSSSSESSNDNGESMAVNSVRETDKNSTDVDTKREEESQEPIMVRVAGGERHHSRARDVPMDTLIGWSVETAALEALYAHKFDEDKAVAAMEESYSETGHWRDKFGSWSAAEAEMICDSASRHGDDLQQLGGVLDSKSPKEVTIFYDHMLRHSSDYQVVTRLFQTAEYSRRSGGSEDPDAHLPRLAGNDGNFEIRKSKRERTKSRAPRLPGEVDSDEEEAPQHSSRKQSSTAPSDGGNVAKRAKTTGAGSRGASASSYSSGGARSGKNSGVKSHRRLAAGGASASGGVGSWTTEYMDQHRETSPKQQLLLKRSFEFLKKAQESLEHKKFIKLIKSLVEFDKGSVEVTQLVQTASEILPPHDHLMGSFKAFLPEKAKLLLTKLVS